MADDGAAPYPRRARRADIRNGRRDGRKHIPSYPATPGPAQEGSGVDFATAYEERLRAQGAHRINSELRAFLEQTDALRRGKSELESLLVQDEITVKDSERLLADARAELSPSDLEARNPHEVDLHRRDPESLRSRRAAERRLRILAAERELERRRAVVADRCRAIAEARGLVEVEFGHARMRGHREAGLCRIRLATYWDAVVQRHPDGRDLATARPPARFDPPTWIDAEYWDTTEPPEETEP